MSTSAITPIQPVGSLADAIASAEGFGVGNNIPTTANNPGSLELGDVGYGTINAANGNQITVFPSENDGWTALNNQLASVYNGTSKYYTPDMSLSEFGNIYSGGNPNYGNTLANSLGVSPDTTLSQFPQSGATPTSVNSQSGTLTNASSKSEWPSIKDLFTSNVQGSIIVRVIVLLIGLVLIIAGLFAFKGTQQLVTTVGKTVGETA